MMVREKLLKVQAALATKSQAFQEAVKDFGKAKLRFSSAESTRAFFNKILAVAQSQAQSEAQQSGLQYSVLPGQSSKTGPLSVLQAIVTASKNGFDAKLSGVMATSLAALNGVLPEDDAVVKAAIRLANPGGANLSSIMVQTVQLLKEKHARLESESKAASQEAGGLMAKAAKIALGDNFEPGPNYIYNVKTLEGLQRASDLGFIGC